MQRRRGHRERAECFLGNLKCHRTVCSIAVSQFKLSLNLIRRGCPLPWGKTCPQAGVGPPLVDAGFGLETTALRKRIQTFG